MVPKPLEKKLLRHLGKAITRYGLIEEGDRIMVCVSGGKDSYVMLHLLRRMQQRAKVRFELLAVHLDQGHPGFPVASIESFLTEHGYDFHIERENTYAIVEEKLAPGATPCSLCSRLRRGILYTTARRLGCDKIALGHHRDDAIETLLLNLFFVGQLKALPPKLRSDDGRNVVIRPLILAPEDAIAEYARALRFPIVPCSLCDRAPDLKRRKIKELLTSLSEAHPPLRASMGRALQNVTLSHLHDAGLFDFAGLARDVEEEVEAEEAVEAVEAVEAAER